jgi:hypothetical protein
MACTASAVHHHDTPRWLRRNGVEWDGGDVLTVAAAGGHSSVVLWARANGACPHVTLGVAVMTGEAFDGHDGNEEEGWDW